MEKGKKTAPVFPAPKPFLKKKVKNYLSSEIVSDSVEYTSETSAFEYSKKSRPENQGISLKHREHLKSEGFDDKQIEWMQQDRGVHSMTEAEARSRKIACKDSDGNFTSSSGLFFPLDRDPNGFGQLRCDDPPKVGIKKDGTPDIAKYLTPCGMGTTAWLPDGCEVVTEGAKDAYAGTLHGKIPTGALPGVSHYRRASNLKRGSKIIILFDADGWNNPSVFTQLFKAGIYTKGKIQLVPEIPYEPKAGLCEFFKAGNTPKDYRQLIRAAMTPVEFLKELPKHWIGLPEEKHEACVEAVLKLCATYLSRKDLVAVLQAMGLKLEGEVEEKLRGFAAAKVVKVKAMIADGKSTPEDLSELSGTFFWTQVKGDPIFYDYLRLFQMGNRLRFNTLKKRVELDGEEIDVGTARTVLNIHYDFKSATKVEFPEILVEAAKKHSYSPVVEYLDRVYSEHSSDTSILENLAWRYFGQTDPIYNTMLVRTLIAAVARAYQPGCKVDTALILQGKQGAEKSTFFKVLAGGDEYFTDSFGNSSDKDERLKIHEVWFCEWAELETVFRRRDVASTKAFLSSSVDLVRPPYGRTTQKMERCSIFVGTTNQDEFLSDSTGNRRFWIRRSRSKWTKTNVSEF